MQRGSIKGFAKRRDANEPQIIAALEAVGAKVVRLSDIGLPDLLVGYSGETYLFEVKREAGPRGGTSHSRLTEDQELWWKEWKGRTPVIVRTPEDALLALGVRVSNVSAGAGFWSRCREHPECDGRNETCCCKDTHEFGTYPRRG